MGCRTIALVTKDFLTQFTIETQWFAVPHALRNSWLLWLFFLGNMVRQKNLHGFMAFDTGITD
jgi:hypothetical protein